MKEALERLLFQCPGAEAAALMDPDGIPVLVEPRGADVEVLGAEMASMVVEMENASRGLQHGRLRQFQVGTDLEIIVLTTIAAGYFLMVFLKPDAVPGRVKFYSRVAREFLYSEFV